MAILEDIFDTLMDEETEETEETTETSTTEDNESESVIFTILKTVGKITAGAVAGKAVYEIGMDVAGATKQKEGTFLERMADAHDERKIRNLNKRMQKHANRQKERAERRNKSKETEGSENSKESNETTSEATKNAPAATNSQKKHNH